MILTKGRFIFISPKDSSTCEYQSITDAFYYIKFFKSAVVINF